MARVGPSVACVTFLKNESRLVGYSGGKISKFKHTWKIVFFLAHLVIAEELKHGQKNVFLSESLHLCQSMSSKLILHHEVGHVQNPYNISRNPDWLIRGSWNHGYDIIPRWFASIIPNIIPTNQRQVVLLLHACFFLICKDSRLEKSCPIWNRPIASLAINANKNQTPPVFSRGQNISIVLTTLMQSI